MNLFIHFLACYQNLTNSYYVCFGRLASILAILLSCFLPELIQGISKRADFLLDILSAYSAECVFEPCTDLMQFTRLWEFRLDLYALFQVLMLFELREFKEILIYDFQGLDSKSSQCKKKFQHF